MAGSEKGIFVEKTLESFLEQTLRQLLTSAVTCTIRNRNHSTGVSIHLKSKYYLAKKGILDCLNDARWKKSHTQSDTLSPCWSGHMQPFHEGQLVMCALQYF